MAEKNDEILTLNLIKLSAVIGISERYAETLKKAGVIVRISHGEYDVAKSVQNFIKFKCKTVDVNAELDFNTEKTLLTKAQREMAELDLEKERGGLWLKTDITLYFNRIATNVKTKLLGLPAAVAPLLLGQTNIGKIQNILDERVRALLVDCSKFDPTQEGVVLRE
ncbi:MAG: hypothetical protein WCP79_06900 [Bacillota bacterium]